jgi:hypothetical protein
MGKHNCLDFLVPVEKAHTIVGEENKVGILFFYYMGDDKIFIQ